GTAGGDVVPGELLLPRPPLLAGAIVTARPRGHVRLDADDRLDAGVLRGPVELVGAEEVAVIRDGHGLLALAHRLVDEPVDLRGPVQQRVVGVDVEVDEVVGIRGSHALQTSPAGLVPGAQEGVGEVTSARPACRCRGPPPAAPPRVQALVARTSSSARSIPSAGPSRWSRTALTGGCASSSSGTVCRGQANLTSDRGRRVTQVPSAVRPLTVTALGSRCRACPEVRVRKRALTASRRSTTRLIPGVSPSEGTRCSTVVEVSSTNEASGAVPAWASSGPPSMRTARATSTSGRGASPGAVTDGAGPTPGREPSAGRASAIVNSRVAPARSAWAIDDVPIVRRPPSVTSATESTYTDSGVQSRACTSKPSAPSGRTCARSYSGEPSAHSGLPTRSGWSPSALRTYQADISPLSSSPG